MNKFKINHVVFIICCAGILYSCKCACTCDRNLGCKILVAKLKSNGNIIATKTYCSQTNYNTDKVLQDSITFFMNRYQTDTTTITSADSIYHFEERKKLSCGQADVLEKSGYGCECAK